MIIDEHEWPSGHDFGSIVCTGVSTDRVTGTMHVREYRGLSTDFSKLPNATDNPSYADLATGSSFFATDTQQISFYNATSKSWSTLA